MYNLLLVIFVLACGRLLYYFIQKFKTEGTDLFSGILNILIYLIFCALIYLAVFTPYYLILDN